MDEEYLERLTRNEERSKSNTHRLDRLEPIVDEIHTMSTTMVRLVEGVKHTSASVEGLGAKVERMDNRIDAMERLPAEDARKYKHTAVTAMISTVAGAIATGLIFLIAQYI